MNEATRSFILAHRTEDVRQLALQGSRHAEVDLHEALVQIAGWQQARTKLPQWAATEGLLYPPHLSMEQCSSQYTALYKIGIIQRLRRLEELASAPPAGAAVFGPEDAEDTATAAEDRVEPRGSLTDLTGGLGIDCAYLARCFCHTTYVERQKLLCQLAEHNFPLLGLKSFTICCGDGVEYLQAMEPVEWIYLDPARRNASGGKVVAIGDCEPNVVQLENLLLQKAHHVLVKLSPMLDLTLALQEMQHVEAAYVVATDGECKELLLQLGHHPASCPEEVPITCAHLRKEDRAKTPIFSIASVEELTFSKSEEQQAPMLLANEPMNYLYEPHAALLKAGAFNILTQRYPVKKLHPNSHLYTSAEPLPQFPGRRFQIMGWSGFGKQELKLLLNGLKQANLTVRNFPLATEALRKKLKLSDGGAITLFATTIASEKHILIKVEPLN